MLREFVFSHRREILNQARARVVTRSGAGREDANRRNGLPIFLDQLGEALRKATAHEELDHTEIQHSAYQHGRDLFRDGFTVDQVVHDYGDLCQVITGLVCDAGTSVPVDEFRTLNLCLDDAIAGAVSAYSQEREVASSAEGIERLGVLAHEMRNLLNAAVIAFASIKEGIVAPAGSTGAMLDRSLMRLNILIDRSLADVRLDAGIQNLERVPVREIMEDVEIGAALVARTRGLEFVVTKVDSTVVVEVDRQILAAALANLLQNAFKFTRAGTTVHFRASTTPDRVLIEVADECGGLPKDMEKLLRPFTQDGHDRTGLGLGLSICVKAVKSMGGELHVRDVPGKGCLFTIDLPKQPAPLLA